MANLSDKEVSLKKNFLGYDTFTSIDHLIVHILQFIKFNRYDEISTIIVVVRN